MLDSATLPNLLRLLVLPFFAYVAWLDIKTRRVPNKLWLPLGILAIVLLLWEVFAVATGSLEPLTNPHFYPITPEQFYTQIVISVAFLIPLAYLFWRIGGFGGADAKAFMVIAILLPVYPLYEVGAFAEALEVLPGVEQTGGYLPAVQTTIGVFSITVLSNTVLVGLLYPVALAGKNAVSGYVSPGMFVAKPVRWDETTTEYGTLLEFPDRKFTDDLSPSGIKGYLTWRRLDLDALRMYLQWRGISLEDVRRDPDRYRDPASLPDEPNPPGDGQIVTDGGEEQSDLTDDVTEGEKLSAEEPDEAPIDDPWGAEAFLDDIEGTAYGTTPEALREGLDTLTEDDVVWISPGIPFLVPMFVGLVVAFTYGDILFAILDGFGFVE